MCQPRDTAIVKVCYRVKSHLLKVHQDAVCSTRSSCPPCRSMTAILLAHGKPLTTAQQFVHYLHGWSNIASQNTKTAVPIW